jgi:hypothetical protein
MPGRRETPADEFYLEARDTVMDAARAKVPRGRRKLKTADGTVLLINWRTPLRVFLLIVIRAVPGEPGRTDFNFQRNGRVNFGGSNRGRSFRESLAAGHELWADRQELLDLAEQIGKATPV